MGFGRGRFGKGPAGKGDYGDAVIVQSFPETYLEDPKTGAANTLLKHYLLAAADSVNRTKTKIDALPEQVDFDQIRQDLIVYLGRTIGVEIDDSEPEEFQRSLVGAAVQFYRIKGTDDSYRIRGKISGFDVDVFNLFRIDASYVPLFDPVDVFEIPTGSGVFYTDQEPGSVSGTPTEIDCTYCQTAAIKITFTIVKPQPPAVIGAANFLDRLVSKLRDIIPIHVRDLLFEIIAFINVDEHQYLEVGLESLEDTFTPTPLFAHFDLLPADCTPLDGFGYVQGTTNEQTI